jgi:hypothetical protein
MAGWMKLEAGEKEMPPPVAGGSQIEDKQRKMPTHACSCQAVKIRAQLPAEEFKARGNLQ